MQLLEENDGELLRAYVERQDEASFRRLHEKYAGLVYAVCLRALGNPGDAEDAAAASFVVLFKKAESLRDRVNLGGWLHTCARRMAWNSLCVRRHRSEREQEAYEMSIVESKQDGSGFESALPAVEKALSELPDRFKEVLVMHFYQGMNRNEIAARLKCPDGTIAARISRGIAKLRSKLAGVMSGVSDEEFCEGLRTPALLLPVPSGLMLKVTAALTGQVQGAGAMELARQGIRSMFWAQAKAVAAVLAVAGIAGGGVFAVAQLGGAIALSGGEGEKPRKFATPVTDPEAQWVAATPAELRATLRPPGVGPSSGVDPKLAGFGYVMMGELDGPAGQVLTPWCTLRPGIFGGLSTGGRYVFMSYDRRTERYHGVTAGAAGLCDGPFSRARFFGNDYVPRQSVNEWPSPDGRYVYLIDGGGVGGRLRCLDFAEQRVSTLPSGSAPALGLSVDGKGRAWVVNWARELVIVDPEKKWQNPQIVKLQVKNDGEEWFAGVCNSIAADEVQGRVYACSSKRWYLWYWDIKDGSFHGVIKVPGKDEPARPGGMGGATPGPFEGVRFYGEGTLGWGPDDPLKRFLYMGQCDDESYYRLDLEKKIVWAFDPKAGRFIDNGGARRGGVVYMVQPTWLEDGSFFAPYTGFYKRVK